MNWKKSLLTCFGLSSIFIGVLCVLGVGYLMRIANPESSGGLLFVFIWFGGFIGWFELTTQLDKKFRVGLFDHHKQLTLLNDKTPNSSSETTK